MDEKLKAQIRQRMKEKDTEDLLAIWQRTDGEVWSDEAYAMARETLEERGIDPPEPRPAGAARAADDDDDQDDDDDEEALYHNPGRLLDVASWSATLSWFFLAVCAGILVLFVVAVFSTFNANASLLAALASLVPLLILALTCGFFFVLAQGVAQIIYVLADIFDAVTPAAEA